MSTEAMREAFETWVRKDKRFYWRWLDRIDGDPDYCAGDIQRLWEAWQAATASQEALIKAALDAAAGAAKDAKERTMIEDDWCEGYHDAAIDIEQAIRQITPQQVMKRLK